IAAIGITNQRETTVVWDRETGKAIYPAIVWQDRRTADQCAQLKKDGHEEAVTAKTGLLLDPYFSGTKVAWILDNVDGARQSASDGKLAFGTIDSFLLWRLTGGSAHATDATNASRTMLYDIQGGAWSDDLLSILNVPASVLPTVMNSADDFGVTDANLFGAAIPITGIAGDQQAATVGQACFKPGMMKSTYGTGCFALLNTGDVAVRSNNRLLTTIAYQIGGKPTYALEGSIFIAGAGVQWLRDGLGIIDSAAEAGKLAAKADPAQDVYLVPAFVGLGAPYWDADCRGALYGLTRATGPAELARATLDSVCFQTRDLIEAMNGDVAEQHDTVLRVDGGMVASAWTMQRLADVLNAPVDQPTITETTALGAAYLAGMHVGMYPGLDEFAAQWALEKQYTPTMDQSERDRLYTGWKDAVRRTLS
ncbi:MAG: glycerol kinase GlpK, partial [Rhodospirillales bacterium]|nr:glycerol kinase GlpK [Rhodospirillales bacterium]